MTEFIDRCINLILLTMDCNLLYYNGLNQYVSLLMIRNVIVILFYNPQSTQNNNIKKKDNLLLYRGMKSQDKPTNNNIYVKKKHVFIFILENKFEKTWLFCNK